MNGDFDPNLREQLEVRIVAMLLGEASEFETAQLQEILAKDAELAAFHDRMKGAIGLVQKASEKAAAPANVPVAQPKLSEERRAVLFKHFKEKSKVEGRESRGFEASQVAAKIAPAESRQRNARWLSWIVPVAAAAVIMFIAAGLFLPALSKAKHKRPVAITPIPGRRGVYASGGSEPAAESAVATERAARALNVPREGTIVSADGERWDKSSSDQGTALPASPPPQGIDLAQVEKVPASEVESLGVSTTYTKTTPSQEPQVWTITAAPKTINSDTYALSNHGEVRGRREMEAGEQMRRSVSAGSPVTSVEAPGIGGKDDSRGFLAGSVTGKADGDGNSAALEINADDLSGSNEFRTYADSAAPETGAGAFGVFNGSVVTNGLPPLEAEYNAAPVLSSDNFFGGALVTGESQKSLGLNFKTKWTERDEELARKSQLADAKAVNSGPTDAPEETAKAPDVTIEAKFAEVGQASAAAGDLVADGKWLFESGRLDEAKDKLNEALKQDPDNRTAHYYKALSDERRVENKPDGSDLASVAGATATTPTRSLRLPAVAEPKGVAVTKKAQAKSEPSPAELAEKEAVRRQTVPAPKPQPEVSTKENAFSTFSLNVSDVSFKLAAVSLANRTLPEPGSIRVEEFINAFNYRDPAPAPGARLAFTWERAQYPFAHNRDVVRFSVQTAARGRELQKPLNLVVLLDNSGSMERADRVAIITEALKVLAQQMRPQDRISVIAFSRTARLWVDGMAGGNAPALLERVLALNPEGGTNLEEALNLGYSTAQKHFMPQGVNRVILLTDGAANLGNVEGEELKKQVEKQRQKGIALDCFGIGWEGYNDDLLEVLSRNGDGRYGFLNRPEQASTEFADQLAGALNVAASDVKTQVEFNPARVTSWRQIGYARHQLTKEQFRDNTVDAAEIAAAEQGNALYVIETNPQGTGAIGVVRVRFKVPETGEYLEQEWPIEYQPRVTALDQASPALRLAVTAAAFGELLSNSPYATDVNFPALQRLLAGVPAHFNPDPRPQQLETMLRQARELLGR